MQNALPGLLRPLLAVPFERWQLIAFEVTAGDCARHSRLGNLFGSIVIEDDGRDEDSILLHGDDWVVPFLC